MSRYSKIIVLLSAVLAIMAFNIVFNNKVSYKQEIAPPIQKNISDNKVIDYKGKEGNVQIKFLAEYSIKAVVKSKKEYNDFGSQIAKYDLALAWGDLNKPEYDKYIQYSQGGRWFEFRFPSNAGKVNVDMIYKNAANVHIIPKDDNVLNIVKGIKTGDYIEMQGYLVTVNLKDAVWKSSLSRDDRGAGSCELMYVEQISLPNKK